MNWYALFTTTGEEDNVADRLRRSFIWPEPAILVPKRTLIEYKAGKKRKVLKNLFPGYVLLNTEMNHETYYKLKNIPNMIRILNYGEPFTKIPEEEMVNVKRLLGEGEVIEFSQVYLVNSRVAVKSGPLQGLEGLIKKVDKRKQRARIVMNFMGMPKEIDLGIEVLGMELER